MKIRNIALAAISLLVFAGCADMSTTSNQPVRLGMSRDDLRSRFGDPLRIEPAAAGGENWYYRFVSWSNHPTGSSETSEDLGGRMSSVSVGWQFTRNSDELPVHLSSDGFVIDPVPEGRIVQK